MTPLHIRRNIPFFYDKTESEFRQDIYERYDEMVVRQTALHLADRIWNGYPFQGILNWILENIPESGNEQIVDIGCGVGRLAATLSKHFPDSKVWGLDYSYQMLRRAHEFWIEGKWIDLDWSNRGFLPQKLKGQKITNLKFGLARADKLPFENNSQNLITHTFLLDRVQNPALVLHELQRVLHPEGRMLLISPLNFQENQHWKKFHPIGKLIYFLQKSGWKIDSWREDWKVEEPLDARGNFVAWKCAAIVAKKND